MKSSLLHRLNLARFARSVFFFSTFCFMANPLLADQVQMLNGDRYFGKVTLGTNSLTLQSEILGTVQLPRGKVASIQLGTNSSIAINASMPDSSPVSRALVPAPKPSEEMPASLRKLAGQTNLINQVQSKFLADAGPEANAKFNELMIGLTTGKLSINDLRSEARTAAAQVRELRRGLDEESSASLDMYLSILDSFLKESPAATASATNSLPKIPNRILNDKLD
ncbi:MAG: hypothetical protein ABIQ35_03350 [Verrucomicrobiota bacterium]